MQTPTNTQYPQTKQYREIKNPGTGILKIYANKLNKSMEMISSTLEQNIAIVTERQMGKKALEISSNCKTEIIERIYVCGLPLISFKMSMEFPFKESLK